MVKRLLELVSTGLFGEEAIITSLNGREEISKPFEFHLSISSPKENLKPEQVIGQPLAVRIDRGDAEPRFIHGYVNSFWAGRYVSQDSTDTPTRLYRVSVVPWLWFLSRASRCFVYLPEKEEKTIQDVLDAVVKRVKSYGHVDPTLEAGNAKILGSRKVEHCVQYRESDFNFLCRTLEKYGIYYYFKHTENKHTLVLSDQRNYPNAPESAVRFPSSSSGTDAEDVISNWEHSYEFVSGKWEQTDYDFINPSTDLKVNALKHSSIPLKNNTAYELYEYPGEYVNKGDGTAEATARLEAEESRFDVVSGVSTCKTFSPGYCFKLTEHPTSEDEKGKTFLLTSVSHSATQPGPYSSSGAMTSYSNSFACIPRDRQYRPSRSTPQPILASVQTAVVVGPPGEEIYTDKYGRVKVQFHWDREGKRDENTSCWVRVTQVHAGKGFGGIDIPRVGDEVVVSFLEGDLDRPLITGRVYHKESMPPFGLPAAKTISGIKTKTYKGKGHNEMSMDDTPGKEKVNIHAQYDMTTTVLHDQTTEVKNDRKDTIDGNDEETVNKNQTWTVAGNRTATINGELSSVIGKTEQRSVTSDQTITVGGKQDTNVVASATLTAGEFIKLVSGAASIELKSDGTIEIKGVAIKIDGTASVKSSAPKVEIEGATIDSVATGPNTVKGAVVKINS